VKRLAALVVKRFAALAVKRFAALVVKRLAEAARRSSCEAVRRSGYEAVGRSSCEAVRRSSCQAVRRSRCAVVVVVVYKAHLLTGFADAAVPKVRKPRARGGGNKDYWGAYWFAYSNGPVSTLDERNHIMRVIIHTSGSPL
jgi:hypothetical protein